MMNKLQSIQEIVEESAESAKLHYEAMLALVCQGPAAAIGPLVHSSTENFNA